MKALSCSTPGYRLFEKVYRLAEAPLGPSMNSLYDERCVDFAGCAAALLHYLGYLGSMVWLHMDSFSAITYKESGCGVFWHYL